MLIAGEVELEPFDILYGGCRWHAICHLQITCHRCHRQQTNIPKICQSIWYYSV